MRTHPAIQVLGLFLACVTLLAAVAATPANRVAAPAAAGAAVAPADSVVDPDTPRVIAYYFHATQRCATCRRIEQWSAQAIQTGFAEQLADGSLSFRPVNTDEKGNEHFLEDYALYTKALVVVDTAAGGSGRWKNLQKVWEHTGDQERFFAYVQDEIRAFLAGKE